MSKQYHCSALRHRPSGVGTALRVAFLGLTVLAFGLPARADLPDDVGVALDHANLKGALKAARAHADDNPSDAVAQQVAGILEIANGDPKAAANDFTDAVQQGDALDTTPTGLEKYDYNGSALREALNRQKVSIALDAGGASAYNNRGAMYIVLGHIEDGLSDLDDAMRKRPHWGTPSANAAVAWMESNSPRNAKKFAKQAIGFDEDTAKVYTTLAEAQMRQKSWKDADQSFKRAEDRDHNYPYELYQRSLWFHQKGQARDEQRALFQAMALDPAIADEDRFQMRNKYSGGSGSQQSDHEHIFNLGRLAGTAYQSTIQRDRGLETGSDGSYQRRDYWQTMVGVGHGTNRTGLYLSFLNENGGRPGGVDNFVIPDATFGFRRANVGLFQTLDIGNGRQFAFEALYRRNSVVERSSETAPNFEPLSDRQYGFEGRYTMPFHKSKLLIGYAWMQNSRHFGLPPAGDPLSGPTFVSPVEPNEQVLQAGNTSLQTFYAISTQSRGPNVTTAYGPMVSANGGSIYVLPYIDVHLTKSPHVGYRLAALPRAMNANADLLPIWALPAPIAEAEENHDQNGTHDFNQNPYIAGQNGRMISLEFSQSQLLKTGSYLTTTAFHRDFHDLDFFSQDPNVSPTLLLTHMPHGTSTGITIDYTQPLPGGLHLDLGGTFQTSHGSLPLSGSPKIGALPEVPKLNGIVGLGFEQGTWDIAVHTIHIGSRTSVEQTPLPTGIGALCGRCNYQVTTVAPMTIMNVTVTHHLPNGQDVVFQMQPVNSSGYYVNYPKKPFMSLGYNYKY